MNTRAANSEKMTGVLANRPLPNRALIGWLLGAVFIAAIAFWWTRNYERVSKQVDLPLSGAASYNPLFALQKTLEAGGLKVRSHADLRLSALNLGVNDTLLVQGHMQTLSAADVHTLLAWVNAGGHLLASLPVATVLHRETEVDEGDSDSDSADEVISPGLDSRLLHQLGIKVGPSPNCAPLIIDTPKLRRSWCPVLRFFATDAGAVAGEDDNNNDNEDEPALAGPELKWQWRWGDAKSGYVMGYANYGLGTMTLASSFKLLSSDRLVRAENQILARQLFLATVQRGQPVHLIYGNAIQPLYAQVLRWAWPILLPLALLLLAWAYARAARFGPLRVHENAPRRALSEHVAAAGEFAFRRARWQPLHKAMLDAALAKLLRKHPQLAAIQGDALADEIAALCGLTQAQTRAALFPTALDRPESFITAIRTLMLLRNHR